MKCPKCNLEIDENIFSCPSCQTQLPREVQVDETEDSAVLMTAKDELQANIVESLLQAYGIPIRKRYKGNDTFGKIFMGLTVHGIDIYVPKAALEEAQGIIENEMPEEEAEQGEAGSEGTALLEESEDADAGLQKVSEGFESKRRVRAWVSLLAFVPGILVLAAVAIYLIFSLVIR